MSETGKTALAEVLGLLDLEQIEENIFRGLSPKARTQRLQGAKMVRLDTAFGTTHHACHFSHVHAFKIT